MIRLVKNISGIMSMSKKFSVLINVMGIIFILSGGYISTANAQKATVGAYYFEGWISWSTMRSWHITDALVNNFPERQPIWGWTDDGVTIMEQQIGLAADHGIAFFAFDWYWQDDNGPINIPAIEGLGVNQGLKNYLQANNKNRLKFCLLVCNHAEFNISGTAAWKQAADYWITYFKDPQYLKVGGKPLLIIYAGGAADTAGLQYLQQLAQQNGLPGIAICDQGNGGSTWDNNQFSLMGWYNNAPGWAAGSEAKDYTDLGPLVGGSASRPCLPLVHAGIDYRPWHDDSWYYSINHTPQVFANKMQQVITFMDNNPEKVTAERIFAIYAWNEIGEGAYLMPTVGDSQGAWLDAIKSAIGYNDNAVANPVISPNGGTFVNSVSVTIICATTGAEIRYTLDGSDPTGASTLYTGPFALSNTTIVKAKGFKSGLTASTTIAATFTKVTSGGNLSLLKPVTAFSIQGSGFEADKAVEGDTLTQSTLEEKPHPSCVPLVLTPFT